MRKRKTLLRLLPRNYLHIQPRAAYSVCLDTLYSAANAASFSPAFTRLRISATCAFVSDGFSGSFEPAADSNSAHISRCYRLTRAQVMRCQSRCRLHNTNLSDTQTEVLA